MNAMTQLTLQEMVEIDGGEPTAKTSFAYDVMYAVGVAGAFYAGMWNGFWG